ncbi:ribosome biogenesis GTPase YlqF [Polycladomyces subterraneus]|uniref:Ribosome biogenesis GTPase A n=1 Tax=Polycladomyces subterraneus TaxID=1016997 RepID=A0ABT8II21_9BACL|nr:ribosome biogenesis GTPase YlqF [Polycladomyces subterraneus]MDN4592402.1 ribosome biogenesis GTPase YlqF [Polycladomyces subterraneus]
MVIQWFPGHMAKAKRQVEEKMKMVDVVLELLDARLPMSSRNPLIDRLVGKKPRLVLLTKTDLADPTATEAWVSHFNRLGLDVLPVDATTGKGVAQIPKRCEMLLAEKFAALARKGIRTRRIRAMILGIPNVGKSTLINRLAKRNAAQTGDRPGVTKGQQWIRIGNALELLDTPGILWPKFEDQLVGLRLAASGAIREEILPLEEVAAFALQYMVNRYPVLLQERYGIAPGEMQEGAWMLEEVGRRRGCMRKGGEVDLEKAAELVVHEIRSGRIGRISLELPDDWQKEGESSAHESPGNDSVH